MIGMANPIERAASRIRASRSRERQRTPRAFGSGRSRWSGGERPSKNTREQLESFRGTVYSAVDTIARRAAEIRPRLHQVTRHRNEQTREQVAAHPFLRLLGRGPGKPHPEYTGHQLRYWTQQSLDLTGEAFWAVERGPNGVPKRVTPLPAHRVTLAIDRDSGERTGFVYRPGNGEEIVLPDWSFERLQQRQNRRVPFVVFFRYPSPKGIQDPRGWSPVQAAAYDIGIERSEKRYKLNFLQQGAQLGGILQTEKNLTREEIAEYAEQFQTRHGGPSQAGKPMILPRGMSWETTEPTPRDLQWVETLGVTKADILQAYGVSEAKLGNAEVGNRATAEAMDVTFNREVIRPRLQLVKHTLEEDFLPIYPGQADRKFFEVDYPNPVPEDREFELEQEKHDLEQGVRSRNEIREERGLDPLQGELGEAHTLPISVQVLDPAESASPSDSEGDE